MKMLLAAMSAAVLASPALAQTTAPVAPAATTSATEAPGEIVPAAPAPAPAVPTDVKSAIAADFANWDKDASGTLTKAEFGEWMTALEVRANKPAVAAADKDSWLTGLFGKADADKSATVTVAEVTTYLAPAA